MATKRTRSKVKRVKRAKRSLKRRSFKNTKKSKRTKRKHINRRTKRKKRTQINRRTKRMKGGMDSVEVLPTGGAAVGAGGTAVETPPEGECVKKESKSGLWRKKYVKIEGKSLNVYEPNKSGEPRGSSIPDLTGVSVVAGEEPFGMKRTKYPKLIISNCRTSNGDTADVELAFDYNLQQNEASSVWVRGIYINEHLKKAIENISAGREWNISLDKQRDLLDKQYITATKQVLRTQVESKIAQIPEESDIFVKTFNRLKRISGASFVRLLRINGVNIVLLGDPHVMGGFGTDSWGDKRHDRGTRQREERRQIELEKEDWVISRVSTGMIYTKDGKTTGRKPVTDKTSDKELDKYIKIYEPDRLCDDYGGAVNPTLDITKHETYASFEAHTIGYGPEESRRNYGIDPSKESCSMADLVKFCIDNSSSVEAFPEASSFGVLTRLDTSSPKYKTMLIQELNWLMLWNGLTPEEKGSAKDIVKVHATDHRAGSYDGLNSLLVILMGRNDISQRVLKKLTTDEYGKLLEEFPMWKNNTNGTKDSEAKGNLLKDRFMVLYKLHTAIIRSDDPWQTIRDIYFCLATFGINAEYLTKDISVDQNHLSDHIELISLEDLCLLLSLRGVKTPEEIRYMKESITDEASLIQVREEIIGLIKSTKISDKGIPISTQYIELYKQHFDLARADYGRPPAEALKINEFLVDYFVYRGFISIEEKPHMVAILHFAGLDFYLGTPARTTTQISTLARPTLMSQLELADYQRARRLSEEERKYYSPVNNPKVDTYTTVNPFIRPGHAPRIQIARTTKLAKQLLNIGGYNDGSDLMPSLSYIFSYLNLIGTAEYSNHYWGRDFLYDVFTSLRLDRLLLKHIPLHAKLTQMKHSIDFKTASTLFDMLEKEIPKAKLGRTQVTMDDYLSKLSEDVLKSKITKASEKPKTILVIGGGSQTNVPDSGDFLVGDQYASGHPVETLKFLQVISEDLNSGRGGGVIDDRSDCSVFEGFFE